MKLEDGGKGKEIEDGGGRVEGIGGWKREKEIDTGGWGKGGRNWGRRDEGTGVWVGVDLRKGGGGCVEERS